MKYLFFLIVAIPFLVACSPEKKLVQQNKESMTNIGGLHEVGQEVSAKILFRGSENTVNALQIQKNGLLKEHITKVEALLVCVTGEVVFENEKGLRQVLLAGDYLKIEPMVKHWVVGVKDSQLLLIK